MLRVAVCVSGGGTNLQAILDAVAGRQLTNTEIALVLSNNEDAYALERAKRSNVPTVVVSRKTYPDADAYDEALTHTLTEADIDLVVLAGFLVKIPQQMVERFRGRIINVHPSLIPSFCGVGYYGLKVHEAALARGVKVSGATVHIVDEDMDTGPILLQKAVEVKEGDTPESLQRRIMEEAEWVLLPKAIQMLADKHRNKTE